MYPCTPAHVKYTRTCACARVRNGMQARMHERRRREVDWMRESELEEKFREMVKQAGGKAYKFVSPGNAGVPDRIVILPEGRICFVELKKKGETPRKLQEHRKRELETLGCMTAVVDDEESAASVIRAILDRERGKR